VNLPDLRQPFGVAVPGTPWIVDSIAAVAAAGGGKTASVATVDKGTVAIAAGSVVVAGIAAGIVAGVVSGIHLYHSRFLQRRDM